MFIIDSYIISAQEFLNAPHEQQDIEIFEDLIYFAKEPNYMEYIPASLLRRMGKAARMGIGSGMNLLNTHDDVDGIIIGTAHGGLEDCIKFLNQIVNYEEGLLTPTNFVQSTPNLIAGQLALMKKNHAYNMTHINKGAAFENSLMDAWMQFKSNNAKKILLGSVEEYSDYNFTIDSFNNKFKKEKIASNHILNSNSIGTNYGEGSVFFILEKDKKQNATEIIDFISLHHIKPKDIEINIQNFLDSNGINPNSIKHFISGRNGDSRLNTFYNQAESLFPQANIYAYKHWVGENPSASAFGVYIADLIAQKTVDIPYYKYPRIKEKHKDKNQYILIYNSYDGNSHHLILMK